MRYALNKAQQIAVDSESPKILCLAGAGTGKTRTLIERIVGLVNRGVEPSSILALTFTNAAAFEMKERYREYVDSGESPEFRTFHSYCYDLMSKDIKVRNALGYTSMPSIADDYKQKRIESEALTQSGIRLSKTKISDPASLSMKEKKDYEILMKFRKRLMVKENLITFDELCQGVCKLFISKDPIVDKYRNMIKYLHVDEYQDTDKVQHNFVMSFSDSANIFVVGDSLQSLYRFRGAVPEIIKSLAVDKDWTVIRLSENYRSTKEICNFANEFSAGYADESYRIPIESERLGRPVEHRQYFYLTDSPKFKDIYKRIALECKCLTGSVAIISRTNSECSIIRDELDKNGVAYSTSHKEVDARFMLPSVSDSKYMINWLATFLPSEQYSEFIRMSTIFTSEGKEYTERLFLNQFNTNREIKVRSESIYKIRGILNSDKDKDNKCKAILNVLGFPNLAVDLSEVSTVSDLLNQIILAVEHRPEQESSVYVGTIHSVKGLEYDTVYVIGVNGRKFKLDSEDNKNCYYVAITRAKENLIIYS